MKSLEESRSEKIITTSRLVEEGREILFEVVFLDCEDVVVGGVDKEGVFGERGFCLKGKETSLFEILNGSLNYKRN